MNPNQNCKLVQHHHQSVISLALVQYNFSTPEIRMLMRYMLGHAVSGRTIKRLARSTGHRLKRGRPPSTPRVSKGDLSNLLELTSNSVGSFAGNTLHLLHEIYSQFGQISDYELHTRQGTTSLMNLLAGFMGPNLVQDFAYKCEYSLLARGIPPEQYN